MLKIQLIPYEEFKRVKDSSVQKYDKLSLLADMCRFNTLSEVKMAGSGHLGSSFSAMDIVVWLYYEELNTLKVGLESPDRDIYFSSKGHDVPGLYAVLHSLGIIPEEKLLKLRRLNGLDGHPHLGIPGIEANSGSLGMGISKGKGIAWSKSLLGNKGHVYVLTGDGELQEGQNFEALQTTVQQGVTNLTIIVDNNRLQTDKLVKEITDLRDLETKFRAFGWHVAHCNGHDMAAISANLQSLKFVCDKPKILIADTIKGRGVSFMEHPTALAANNGVYLWHSGAPDDESFLKASSEILEGLNSRLKKLGGLDELKLKEFTSTQKEAKGVLKEYVANAYGEALLEIAAYRQDIVVLDGDLAADCRVRKFEETYPVRFIENGIAEQDMVSMAGGIARQGLLPVVNSFASFLASRANEQIYNCATENTKIIYACHFAGLIPAGPGKSHQSIRDISLFGALPNVTILQPCNAIETIMAVHYCVEKAKENCVLRLIIGPSPRTIELPLDYQLEFGKGVSLTEGKDAILFGYGPVMLNEALVAAETLAENGFELKVVNMPWLNHVDANWLKEIINPFLNVYILEDHGPVGGLGDCLLRILSESDGLEGHLFNKFAVEGYPACGAPFEVLKHHNLDGRSLANRILGKEIAGNKKEMVYSFEAPQ